MSVSFRASGMLAVAIGLVLSGALIAACSGDGGGSDSPSKEDFIAQADRICADISAESDALVPDVMEAIDQNDFDTVADLYDELATGLSQGLDEIEALGSPEGDEQTIDQWLALGRETVAIAGEIEDLFRAQDTDAVEAALEEGRKIASESDSIADDYGMVDCGSAGNDI